MVENDMWTATADIKLRYKGVYDMKGVLRILYNWYIINRYDYHEDLYKDKLDTPLGNEIEIKMKGEKKVSEYLKYVVKFYTHQWEAKDVVVKVGDKEVKMMTGRLEIKMEGRVVSDWQNRFKAGTIWEKAQKFMEKVVLRKEIEFKHIDPMEKELHALSGEIKRFLKMESS
jgi:hypothetical protein